MKVGITGSQKGTTFAQSVAFRALLRDLLPIEEAHHGCCEGVDAEAHYDLQFLQVPLVLHPPTDEKKMARLPGGLRLPARPYLERNAMIVGATDLLVACPSTNYEARRSGTWATIRLARQAGKPVIIVRPDGKLIRERLPSPSVLQ